MTTHSIGLRSWMTTIPRLMTSTSSADPSRGGTRTVAGPNWRRVGSGIQNGTRAVVSHLKPTSTPNQIDWPSGIGSLVFAPYHSLSVIAAESERVGALHENRRQCERVIVGLLNLRSRLSTVIRLNGLASLTTAMSSTSPPSGTAYSWSATWAERAWM
jgi:hypothetical protein